MPPLTPHRRPNASTLAVVIATIALVLSTLAMSFSLSIDNSPADSLDGARSRISPIHPPIEPRRAPTSTSPAPIFDDNDTRPPTASRPTTHVWNVVIENAFDFVGQTITFQVECVQKGSPPIEISKVVSSDDAARPIGIDVSSFFDHPKSDMTIVMRAETRTADSIKCTYDPARMPQSIIDHVVHLRVRISLVRVPVVCGTVVDADGPIFGAMIRFYHRAEDAHDSTGETAAVARTFAESDGTFELRLPRAMERAHVVVEARDHLPADFACEILNARQVDLGLVTLSSGHRLSGTIRWADQPIGDAHLIVEDAATRSDVATASAERRTAADGLSRSDGTFDIFGLENRPYVLRIGGGTMTTTEGTFVAIPLDSVAEATFPVHAPSVAQNIDLPLALVVVQWNVDDESTSHATIRITRRGGPPHELSSSGKGEATKTIAVRPGDSYLIRVEVFGRVPWASEIVAPAVGRTLTVRANLPIDNRPQRIPSRELVVRLAPNSIAVGSLDAIFSPKPTAGASPVDRSTESPWSNDSGEQSYWGEPSTAGEFRFDITDLAADRYRLRLTPRRGDLDEEIAMCGLVPFPNDDHLIPQEFELSVAEQSNIHLDLTPIRGGRFAARARGPGGLCIAPLVRVLDSSGKTVELGGFWDPKACYIKYSTVEDRLQPDFATTHATPLPAGIYQATFILEGYVEKTIPIAIRPGHTTTIDVDMERD